MMNGRQLIAELSERDLETPVTLEDGREIVDIEYTEDGRLVLIGEDNGEM